MKDKELDSHRAPMKMAGCCPEYSVWRTLLTRTTVSSDPNDSDIYSQGILRCSGGFEDCILYSRAN